MTLDQAKKVLCPFKKHKGRTLQQIGDDDPLYLDWLAGLDDLRGELGEAVPMVARSYARDIEEAMDRRGW